MLDIRSLGHYLIYDMTDLASKEKKMKKIVTVFPDCEYCKKLYIIPKKAIYRVLTIYGSKRMLCECHFGEYGSTAKGNTARLVVGTLGEK